MLKLLNVKIIIISLLLSSSAWCGVSTVQDNLYVDNTKLISQQTELLKNRLAQAQQQYLTLESQQETPQLESSLINHTSKQLRNQAALDTSVAKSNVDSINIELSESDQTMARLEKEIQEIGNQLNVFSIFGVKLTRNEALNINGLHAEMKYKKNLYVLEKQRAAYLSDLEKIAVNILQLQKSKFDRINILLKSNTITQLKEQQAQSEVGFQQQQSYWLQRLNVLYAELNQNKDKAKSTEIEREIFYANENLNFTYLQMLIMRYQDQLQQLKIIISHSGSITLLNKASDQVQALTKQLARVKVLLSNRVDILDRRKVSLTQDNEINTPQEKADLFRLTRLATQYQLVNDNVNQLDQTLLTFHTTLDQALQYELSTRQALPGLDAKAWFSLGAEVWFVPTLAFQVMKSLGSAFLSALQNMSLGMGVILALIEIVLVLLFVQTNRFLGKLVSGMAEHEFGHINLKRLSILILKRNLIDIMIIGNIAGLLTFFDIPSQSSSFVINLALVWVFFKVIITLTRVCLVETTHDRSGHDVRLYHSLKWTFLAGGLVTALTVLVHQLPVIYELKDLFNRLFLLFLLVVSVFLLKSWEVVPGLILPHIDERRPYLKKIVQMLGLLIPLILLSNSAIGLFGYVNLVMTMSWYESVFLLVLVGYLIVRGLLIDGMELLSTLLIRHVGNGWLWTEAFLKPADKVLRISLFISAWVVLFMCYGWNQQSPVVGLLNVLLHYHLVDMLNTSITVFSLIELSIIFSLLHWAARWSREFVYRLLLSRTKDLGLRNSLAIFSQYMTIVVGIFICLRILGIDFRALTVVAGAFAFSIGLGLRDLANNFVCGFLLLIERPVRVGDTITINNYEGEVTHIGGRAVTVRTWDNLEVFVPNAEIFSKSFTNWTAKDYVVRSIISIKINCQDDPLKVQEIIHHVLAEVKNVLTEPAPEVYLKELSDALIELEVRYFVNLRQVKSRSSLRSEVLTAIWEAFKIHNIQPPYPPQEIHVRNTSMPVVALGYAEKDEKNEKEYFDK
ncbi:MAG: mechanosensitive ion channel [Gammaproteobacteria bacterium]|nr:mechanosensitive ion channel [Gammaproteobacteria bacterium]